MRYYASLKRYEMKKLEKREINYLDGDFIAVLTMKNGSILIRNKRPILDETSDVKPVFKYFFQYEDFFYDCFMEIILPEDRPEVEKKLRLEGIVENLKENPVYNFVYKIIRNGEIRKINLTFSYLNTRRRNILITYRDITGLSEQSIIALKRIQESLYEAKAMNMAKSDFLSRISHDMRTPMNGILGMTYLTLDMEGLPEMAVKNLMAIKESGEFLLRLINDTLDMSKIERNAIVLNPEIINVGELVRNIITTVDNMIKEKNIDFKFISVNTDLGFIHADRLRLQQIFINLLSNAVKFTQPGGKVTWTIEALGVKDGVANMLLTIEDTGIGISNEFLPHIFEPFAQENGRTTTGLTGTGLGMPIVYNLVKIMGGKIKVESELGVGTKVSVWLDFKYTYTHTSILEAEVDKVEQDGLLENKRVLLVEDHDINAQIATKLLQKKGMVVERAENGKVAVDMFQKSSEGYYDIVLMDIKMPIMNGLIATKLMRAMERDDAPIIPIVAMSASAFESDCENARRAGMNDHVSKPVDPRIMYEVIEKHLR